MSEVAASPDGVGRHMVGGEVPTATGTSGSAVAGMGWLTVSCTGARLNTTLEEEVECSSLGSGGEAVEEKA